MATILPHLTRRQLQVLTLVVVHVEQHGDGPTLQKRADDLSISKITVFEHVEALIEKRCLYRAAKNAAGALRPTTIGLELVNTLSSRKLKKLAKAILAISRAGGRRMDRAAAVVAALATHIDDRGVLTACTEALDPKARGPR